MMFTIEGICDWCKQPALLTTHQYIDGKVCYSCQACYEHACLDVKLYNEEEELLRQSSLTQSPDKTTRATGI
jgi:GH43 family beta-xylosidase